MMDNRSFPSAKELRAAARTIESYNRTIGLSDAEEVGVSPFMLRREANQQDASALKLYRQFHDDLVAAAEAELAEVQAVPSEEDPELLAEFVASAKSLRHYAVLVSAGLGHRMLAAGWTRTEAERVDR